MPSLHLYTVGGRLSIAELSAARLDGHLVELGDCYIPADAVETASLRAASLAGVLGEALAATHLTAAWVHGALPEPPVRHTVQRASPRRLHHVFGLRILYRELRVADADLQRIGSVLVTSPVRTLADLARVPDHTHARAARLMAGTAPMLASAAIEWIGRAGALPYKRAALELLTSLQAEVVTKT